MRANLQNLFRLLRIARILARHDALAPLEQAEVAPFVVSLARLVSRRRSPGRPGEKLARALTEAGPSFIKLGQALSTRADLVGEEVAGDLALLQDDLKPFSSAQARAAIEEEFGKPLTALFSGFNEVPVAAASIAQVHFATTTDGRDVAVKILRPGVEKAFAADLGLFRWGADLVERAQPSFRRLKPLETVETIAAAVELEMDLRFEAAAGAEMAENFQGDDSFHVPAVDWSRTGKRVMTTERIDGVPINDVDALIAAGHDAKAVVTNAARTFFNQVFRDGFFHADLHPGNLFVLKTGAVAAVDFGIVGRIDYQTRRTLGEMLLAFLNRDYRRAAEVHFEAGWVPRAKSVDAFTQACRSIAEPILDKPQNEISIGRLLGQLFQITDQFDMEAQPQLLLLQKTMLTAEGVGRAIYPDVNMWVLARPLVEDWMRENLGPEAKIRNAVLNVVDSFERLPRVLNSLEESSERLANGKIELSPETMRRLSGGDKGQAHITALWIATMILSVLIAVTLLG